MSVRDKKYARIADIRKSTLQPRSLLKGYSQDMKREPAKNTFEAWNFLWYETTVESHSALAVAFALLGFWNMDGKGRCNPSIASIMEKSRIKSKNTVKRAIEELEESGEWVAVRSKGRHSTQYFPMFVSGARKELLNSGFEDLNPEKYQDLADAEFELGDLPEVIANAEVESSPDVKEKAEELLPVPDSPEEITVSEFEILPKIKNEKDLSLKNGYDEIIRNRFSKPDGFSIPEDCVGIDILNEGDVENFGLAKGNPNRVFVSGSEGFEFLEELPCRWIEKYGKNYGEILTYSSIAELYNSLNKKLLDSGSTNPADYFPVDTAMWVLGADGFVPSEKAVKALIYGTKLDFKMRELQRRYEATLEGRRLTYEQKTQGLFTKKSSQYSSTF